MIDIMKLVETPEESVFSNKSEKLKIKQHNKKMDFWVCY